MGPRVTSSKVAVGCQAPRDPQDEGRLLVEDPRTSVEGEETDTAPPGGYEGGRGPTTQASLHPGNNRPR